MRKKEKTNNTKNYFEDESKSNDKQVHSASTSNRFNDTPISILHTSHQEKVQTNRRRIRKKEKTNNTTNYYEDESKPNDKQDH